MRFFLRFFLRFFVRDLRAGELTALALALCVAVASVTSVAFLADRIHQALRLNAHQLLGGDLKLVADQALPPALREEAQQRGLKVAESLSFLSMASTTSGQEPGAQLSAVKAVGAGYPLRGALRIAAAASGLSAQTDREARQGPPRGSVWVEPRFLALTGARVGDSLQLGEARLTLAALLTHEPDQGLNFFNVAPRLMLNLDDVPATGLLQPGSRIQYQLYVAGPAEAVAAYRAWLTPRLTRGQQLQGLEDARPEVRAALERAQRFLGLTALLAVVLAAVAVRMATRRYVERHFDGFAVMRSLGATQRQLVPLFGSQFVLLGGLAGGLGSGLGYLAQGVMTTLLGALLGDLVAPAPSLMPILQGVLTGYVLLLGFALPPLLALRAVPALRVLRREMVSANGSAGGRAVWHPSAWLTSAWLTALLGISALGGLLYWQVGDARLASFALGGFAGAFLLFSLAAYGAIGLVSGLAGPGLRHHGLPFAWRHGLANLARRKAANIVQIVALGLGLTALLLLAFTQADLLNAWQVRIPADAPNRFIINIQPEQRDALRAVFRAQGLAQPVLHPMVRARLTAINNVPINPLAYTEDRARRLAEREFNLSYMPTLPRHNQVIAGQDFAPGQSGQSGLSVEEGIAEKLGIRLGDTLTWSVAGNTFSARVTSLRRLNWDSMQVNFFVITTPNLLAEQPASWITSFRLPPGADAAMSTLVRTLPNLTVIDISAVLKQINVLTQRTTQAVQFVFLFALAAGVLVLYTTLLGSRDERRQEAALMRALGASRAQVVGAQRNEALAIGLLTGVLATLAAAGIGHILAVQVFELPGYTPHPGLWLAGPVLGLLGSMLNAWLSARAALESPPSWVLREA